MDNVTIRNSFLVSLSTMYLRYDIRKIRFETVLHTYVSIYVCESQRSLLSMAYICEHIRMQVPKKFIVYRTMFQHLVNFPSA